MTAGRRVHDVGPTHAGGIDGVAAPAALPTGTVTFLFTDVEGSTQLWERHGEVMRDALAGHDAMLREAIEGHRGVVFKTVGDAFCAAFLRPEYALEAALDAQRRLRDGSWPAPITTMRVRMGIHTGTAVETGGDYFGPTVNRVARLTSIGHGEQILVSNASALLLRDALPPDVSLRDLGSHRLKNLSEPEIAYQVVATGLRDEFPRLHSLVVDSDAPAPLHNLPYLLTTFLGREDDIETVKLELSKYRLVTLAGHGGIGKTRMAIEAGWQLLDTFPDGVLLVELAPLADPNLVPARVGAALGVPAQAGELSGDLWLDAVREKRALVVLDNCEHVIAAAGDIAHRLLQRCPNLRVLATSREALRIPGERVVRIAPLAVPARGHDGVALGSIRDASAVRLFLDRVSNVAPDFSLDDHDRDGWTAVADICTHLDGIPLALELAAARLPTLGLHRIANGLDDRFKLLTGGARTALPRQQTLEAMLDWSYTALPDAEQQAFNRVGVFAGSFTAEAASAVCCSDALGEEDVLDMVGLLVDKSLVVMDRSGSAARYRLLETTRAYALKKLAERAELSAVQRKHSQHYHALSLEARAMFGTVPLEEWIARYEPEVDNFRSALSWSIESRGDVLLGARILCNLKRVFDWLSLNAEVLSWCDRVLAALGAYAPPNIEAELGIIATRHYCALGTFHAGIAPSQRAVALLRSLGATIPLAYALTFLGRTLASDPDRREEADRAIDEALAIYDAAERGLIDARNEDGDLARRLMGGLAAMFKAVTIDPRELDRRRQILKDALARFSVIAPGYFIIGIVLQQLSDLELEAGNLQVALERALESVEFFRHSSSAFGNFHALNAAGTATLACGDVAAARSYAGELLSWTRRTGSAAGLAMVLLLLAAIDASSDESVRAAGLLGAWEVSSGRIDGLPATTEYLCARTRTMLASNLDDRAREDALAAGRRWSVEAAIDVAFMAAEQRPLSA